MKEVGVCKVVETRVGTPENFRQNAAGENFGIRTQTLKIDGARELRGSPKWPKYEKNANVF